MSKLLQQVEGGDWQHGLSAAAATHLCQCGRLAYYMRKSTSWGFVAGWSRTCLHQTVMLQSMAQHSPVPGLPASNQGSPCPTHG